MNFRQSRLRVNATSALALILSLGFGEVGVGTSACAPTPQEGQKKKPSNVDKGVEKPPPRVAPTAPQRVNFTYRIFKRASDGRAEEANPDSTFQQGDRIQLRVKPSRPGYLYIIQSEGDKDGE